MTKKYWKSQKDSDLLKLRRQDFGKMIDFLNAKISTQNDDEFYTFIIDTYIQFMMEEGFYELMQKELFYLGDIGADATPERVKNKKDIFSELHQHLGQRFGSIIKTASSGEGGTLFKIDSPLSLAVQSQGDRFMEFFKDEAPAALNVNAEKRKLDIRLLLFIRDLDLKPARFRKCDKCEKYFYQPTSRGKNYCSPQCAGAVRQSRYIKKQEERGR